MEDDVFLRPDEPMTLASKPICRIPKLWRKLIHEARQPVITVSVCYFTFVAIKVYFCVRLLESYEKYFLEV